MAGWSYNRKHLSMRTKLRGWCDGVMDILISVQLQEMVPLLYATQWDITVDDGQQLELI